MGNCATNGGSNAAQIQTKHAALTSTRSHQYTGMNVDVMEVVTAMEDQMFCHAIITWVGLPLFGAAQAFVPLLQPSCETGFQNMTLLVVACYEAHHMFSESKVWHAMMNLLSPPEITVLRHLGVLSARKSYFWLGFVESLDLYMDVTFPFVARACDAQLTARWNASWAPVPVVGPIMSAILDTVRFWGFCVIVVAINVLVTGWLGLILMRQHRNSTDEAVAKAANDRISGEIFFNFAQSAETAMMPSVAMLSEEIASERKYTFDRDKDATEAMKAREDIGFGKTTQRQAMELELADHAEEKRVAQAANCHFVGLMVMKVLMGYCMQLFLQSSFYAVTFDSTGPEAKVKVVLSMLCSAIQALIRCKIILPKLGGIGLFLSFFALIIIGWSGAKVYYTYTCESHMWGFSTGCVHLTAETKV